MKFVGVEARAIAARSAINRLRWEIEYAIEEASGDPAMTHRVTEGALPLAEIVAIVSEIGNDLDRFFRPGHPAREDMAGLLEFYRSYHRMAR